MRIPTRSVTLAAGAMAMLAPLAAVAAPNADAATRSTITSWAEVSDDGSTINWKVGSRALKSTDSGRQVELRITPDDASRLDCSALSVSLVGPGGSKAVNYDPYRSGCWGGGAALVLDATASMAGQQLQAFGKATPVAGFREHVFDTRVTIGSNKATGQVKVVTDDQPSAGPAQPDQPAQPAGPGTAVDLSSLPKVPWEGGSAFYSSFPSASKAGWADATSFPISMWWGGIANDDQAKADKARGFDNYLLMNPNVDVNLFERNGLTFFGKKGQNPSNATRGSQAWVGDMLEDEAEAWAGDQAPTLLSTAGSSLPDRDKPRLVNSTALVYSWYANNPTHDALSKTVVNNFSDVASTDAYWFSSGQCDQDVVHGDSYATPFTKENCRTPQAYGRNMKSLRWRDAQDGKLQPLWAFIESVPTGTDDGTVHYRVSPDEVKGAAMSAVINEARGIVWFGQSFGDKQCVTGNSLRSADDPDWACAGHIKAVSEVNNLLKSLAPVLNTQTIAWDTASGSETMLKQHDGSAYLFAMPADSGVKSGPGSKTFTLPDNLKGRTVQVVGEDRTIAPNADGTFTDTFATLSSFHVYKIS